MSEYKRYYHTPESVQEYIKLAEGIDGSKLIEKLRGHLKEGLSVLEFGSGPGKDWNILKKYYDMVGSDLSEEFILHLKSHFPEGEFVKLDAITIEIDRRFDGIYSNKVLHHLSDNELKKSIENQFDTLKDNGVICHSFWKGEGSEIFKGMFVNYHDRNSLNSLITDYFEILLFEDYKEFEDGDSLLLIAKKI